MAQTVHAAGESAAAWAVLHGCALPEGTHAVALEARDEAQLLEAAARLQDRGVRHVVIREPDAPYLGAAMAIGILPTSDRRSIQKALGRLRLLQE